jgi:hypothetical protein
VRLIPISDWACWHRFQCHSQHWPISQTTPRHTFVQCLDANVLHGAQACPAVAVSQDKEIATFPESFVASVVGNVFISGQDACLFRCIGQVNLTAGIQTKIDFVLR